MSVNSNSKQGTRARLAAASLAAAVVICGTAQAEEAIPVGGGYLYPFIGVNVTYDDNIFLQDRNEKSSLITVISPGARLEFNGEITEVALDFRADYGTYDNSRDDDYIDTVTTLSAAVYPTERLSFSGELSYTEGHESRGTFGNEGTAATVFSSPDEYHTWKVAGGVKYGRDVSGAPRIEIDASRSDRTYENNRAATRARDLETNTLKAAFFYNIMPSTALLLEGTATDVDYAGDVAGGTDGEQYRILAGVTWEATYQTTGFLKLGRTYKNFNSSAMKDTDAEAWEVGVTWQPLSYTSVTFKTSADIGESSGIGSSINNRTASLAWDHSWNRFLTSAVGLTASNADYNDNGREDDTLAFDISGEYQMNSWLRLGANFSRSERDSKTTVGPAYDYENNRIGAYVLIN